MDFRGGFRVGLLQEHCYTECSYTECLGFLPHLTMLSNAKKINFFFSENDLDLNSFCFNYNNKIFSLRVLTRVLIGHE